MGLSKTLWENNYEIALLSLNSKFVQGIKNGNLPKEKFQKYIAQDYFFLESFARSYGLAVSKSKDKITIKILSELLLGVSEELILHETYAKEWDINLTTNNIEPATKNYTDFLNNVSSKYGCIEILCSMTPCMRLYAWLGKNMSNYIKNNRYKDWILTYSDEGFENLAEALEKLIDNYKDPNDFKQLNDFYNKAMKLEFDFFNAYSDF